MILLRCKSKVWARPKEMRIKNATIGLIIVIKVYSSLDSNFKSASYIGEKRRKIGYEQFVTCKYLANSP